MKKRIAITGATGFIATEFCKCYAGKYEFIPISRTANPDQKVYSWADIESDHAILAGVDCVLNLAGANIGDKRWSNTRRDLILSSRLETTNQLVGILNNLPSKPDLICASAVGIYPTHGVYDEYSPLDFKRYDNFCEAITKQWELVTKEYTGRVINTRFGVVLSGNGGALSKILLPFKMGIGSAIAGGKWPFSWISITDLCRAIDYIIDRHDISGPINLVAPEIITYQQLIETISQVYKKKCLFNLQKWQIKLMFGQMGEELLLSGQQVIPKKLIELNFTFTYPEIDGCINAIHDGII